MNKNAEERLATQPVLSLVFSIAIPSVLAQLVNLLYGMVDRIYIGHVEGVGMLALTGLGLCTPIILIVSAFAAFAGQGGAPLAAMELGRGDREQAGKILSVAASMLIFAAVCLTALLLIFKVPLLYFFGASADTIRFADQYISIYLCGSIFVLTSLGLNSYITCQGQATAAMLSIVIGAVANLVLDPIFIFGFKLGIRGAAIATILSQLLSAVWVVRFLQSKKSSIHIVPKYMIPDRHILGRIAALGASPFTMQSTESLIAIVFTSCLQKYGGDLYVGSYTILQSLMQLMFIPVSGFSFGTQPIISYNYGAGKLDRVRQNYRIVFICCFLYSSLFYLLVLLFPRTLAGLFTNDEALMELAASKLPMFLVGFVLMSIQMSTQVTLIGIGRAKPSLFLACLRKIILLAPLVLLLPLKLGVNGVYLAEPISDVISAATSLVVFLVVSKKYLREAQ